MRPPPVPIVLALLAALLGILAAARPSFTAASTLHDPIVLIVDRGLTMSARTPTGYRFTDGATRVSDELKKRFSDREIKLITVPGGPPQNLRLSGLAHEIQSLPPTACDTGQALTDVIAGQDATSKSQIIVITDHDIPGEHIIRVVPESRVQDVAITRLSVREIPTTQAMVEIRNQSARAKTTLRLSTGSFQSDHSINLPPAPQTRNYFFDLPIPAETVQAQLLDGDDIPANDFAWAVRETRFPKIEPSSPLPPGLSRIIEAYSEARPATFSDSRILIVTDGSALPPTEKGAIVLPAQEPSHDPVLATDHDITRHVNWQGFSRLKTSTTPPPESWIPIVTSGPRVLVAIKTGKPRQAWMAFDADGWESTTDFVIFWTNVFDWIGSTNASGFVSHPLADWKTDWKLAGASPPPGPLALPGQWPGLYTRSDNQTRAFNAPDLSLETPLATDWPPAFWRFTTQQGAIDLSPVVFLCALAALLAAIVFWRR
jgi:hypothetical protein